MLLKWSKNDPVSQREIDRNNAVYNFQGNRNPFIDHPEFIEEIWTTTLSIDETIDAKSSFRISPNPVKSGEIYISGIDDLSKVNNVQIFDFSGKIVKSISNPFKGTNKINLNNLSKGMYILRINNQTQKFIVE